MLEYTYPPTSTVEPTQNQHNQFYNTIIQSPGILKIDQPVPQNNRKTVKWKIWVTSTLLVEIIENQEIKTLIKSILTEKETHSQAGLASLH